MNHNDYKPLVSIIIPNFNHSRYLDQSIQSALDQTYPNTEIIINDNASTDDSIRVAAKYLDRGVIINKNPDNILNSNYRVVFERSSGKYFVLLCADDVLLPHFVEKAVSIMEKHENIGFVHQERTYIDEDGNMTELDPFFNCSFTVSGEKMLPIFMLTDIGQSAQGLIRRSAFEKAGYHDTEHDHLNIDKEQWFRLCMNSDYAYLREVGTLIRLPAALSQTTVTVNSFYHPIALFVTLKGFIEWGKLRGYEDVVAREKMGMKKLARECIGMVKALLTSGDFDTARKYLLFMELADDEIVVEDDYKKFKELCDRQEKYDVESSDKVRKEAYSRHSRNYPPPNEYVEID